jgi:hypothetical protein
MMMGPLFLETHEKLSLTSRISITLAKPYGPGDPAITRVRIVCPLPGRRCLTARKAGQLIACGPRTWLVRVSIGREPETGTRKYRNKTIRRSFREAQIYTQPRNTGVTSIFF